MINSLTNAKRNQFLLPRPAWITSLPKNPKMLCVVPNDRVTSEALLKRQNSSQNSTPSCSSQKTCIIFFSNLKRRYLGLRTDYVWRSYDPNVFFWTFDPAHYCIIGDSGEADKFIQKMRPYLGPLISKTISTDYLGLATG